MKKQFKESEKNSKALKLPSKLPFYFGVVVTLAVSPWTFDGFNHVKMLVLSVGAAFLAFKFYNTPYQRSGVNTVTSLVFYSFLLALALLVLTGNQSFFNSIFGTWGRSNGALTYTSLAVFFYFISNVRDAGLGYFYINFLSNFGIVMALYGLIQKTGNDFLPWDTAGNPIVLTLGNINFASAFMAMTCIATATRILHLQSKGIIGSKFLFQILSFGTQSFVLYLTDSTQGLVVILVGLVFLSIFSFYDQLLNHGFAPKFLLFMGVTITGATITLGIRGFGPLAPLLSSGLRSIEDRFYHWISAIRMFREFPYSGVGIDSFGDWYPKFRTEEAIQLRGSVETYTNNAHSVPFQLAATGGLLLLIPYLALVLLVCFRGIRLLRNLPSDPIVAGVVSIWVVYQLQSLVSIDQVGLAVWGWVSAGVILSVDQNFQRTQVSSRSPDKKIESKKLSDLQSAKMGNNLAKSFRAPLILVVYLWLAIAIVFPSMINEARINKEVNFVRYASSITKDGVDKSAISDSINRLFELGEESTSPTLRVFLIQELTKYGYISRLQEFAENTTQQFPRNVNAWNSLAQIYEQTGQLELAVAARERQLSLDPLNNLVLKKLSENRQALNPNE